MRYINLRLLTYLLTYLLMSVGLVGFAGRMETPGGPDSGPRAVCWTPLRALGLPLRCIVSDKYE